MNSEVYQGAQMLKTIKSGFQWSHFKLRITQAKM